MYKVLRNIYSGGVPFAQVEGVYFSLEEAESTVSRLREMVVVDGVRMNYQIVPYSPSER